MSKTAAAAYTESFAVEKSRHGAIIGKGGSVL